MQHLQVDGIMLPNIHDSAIRQTCSPLETASLENESYESQ